jgi:hypothetical protein
MELSAGKCDKHTHKSFSISLELVNVVRLWWSSGCQEDESKNWATSQPCLTATLLPADAIWLQFGLHGLSLCRLQLRAMLLDNICPHPELPSEVSRSCTETY